ncbi:hypothetical protein ACIQ9P_04130 [Kitasatospora sp. NPDC094019]|uniref:hypothetical protein n=1 Tax=Kitasatospora sp. NPDC094019 TaxID=3364091 RepID=UPI003817D963
MPKKPKPPRHEELVAETLVNHVLGTRTLSRDDNSQDGMIDALLAPPGAEQPSTALEITSTVDQGQARLWGFVGMMLVDEVHPELAVGWFVEFAPDAPVGRRPKKQLIQLLADLEAREVPRVSVRDWEAVTPTDSPVPEDIARLRALGVRAAAQVGDGPEVRGRIIPSTITTGTAPATAEAVTPYLDAFLATGTAANKLRKLQRAKDDGLRTLLFIWADSSHMTIGMALRNGFEPGGEPNVPQQADEVWLASYFTPDTLFRWTREAGWEVVRTPGVFASVAPF